jgi:hypothetical protein
VTPFDLLDLDRLVAKSANRLRTWRRGGSAEDAPAIEKEASSKATFDDLRGITGDPLAPRLAAHVAALAVDRVTIADEARVAKARWVRSDSPAAPEVSVVSAVRRLLDTRTDRDARSRELAVVAPPVHDAVRVLVDRRREAVRLLGLPGLSSIEHEPFTPPGAAALAEAALRATDGAFGEIAGEPMPALLDRAVCADAGEGWPARITARWTRDVFGTGPLFDGVAIELGEPPAALGASSFARVLARAGRELAVSDRPPGVPFAITRDPFDLLASRRAALFAGLVMEPAFHTRLLGLGPARAREQTRKVARGFLISIRLAALRALAWSALVAGERAGGYPDLVERCLGRPLSPALAGVFPRASQESALELAGIFAAVRDRAFYRDRFDEDWFQNPRAHEALRHEHHAARPGDLTDDAKRDALGEEADRKAPGAALERTLAEALAW